MTMATITNSRALWFVGSFALVASLAFVSGYFAASMRLSGQLGEMAMGAMMQEVSALAYLERQDMPSAQRMLRMAVESNILAVSKSGTPVLDRYAPTSRAECREAEVQRHRDRLRTVVPAHASSRPRIRGLICCHVSQYMASPPHDKPYTFSAPMKVARL